QFFASILDTIGNTPIVRLNSMARDCKAALYAKLEYFNPGGSVKDRIAVAIVAAVKGYRAILCMPDKVSVEKINLLKSFGAEVVVTPTAVPPDSPDSY